MCHFKTKPFKNRYFSIFEESNDKADKVDVGQAFPTYFHLIVHKVKVETEYILI